MALHELCLRAGAPSTPSETTAWVCWQGEGGTPTRAGGGGQGWNSFLNMRSALHFKEACGSPQAIKALQSHSPAGRERFNGLLGGVTPWVWGKLGNVFVLQCCFWLFVDVQPDIIFLL